MDSFETSLQPRGLTDLKRFRAEGLGFKAEGLGFRVCLGSLALALGRHVLMKVCTLQVIFGFL